MGLGVVGLGVVGCGVEGFGVEIGVVGFGVVDITAKINRQCTLCFKVLKKINVEPQMY